MSLPGPWKTAWLTGASSGLGRAIAQRLAGSGCHVAASARSAAKLEELCRETPGITAYPLDVRDVQATNEVASKILAQHGIPDLILLNAGVGTFKKATRFDAELFRNTMETNVIGIGNALATMIPAMVERGSGHIALMGSLASYRGFPRAAHYAPSKAALKSLAECLRFDLEDKGIIVTIINPGYIETQMTENLEVPMPGLMGLEPAVDRIMKGLTKQRYEIAFPWTMAMVVKLGVRVYNDAYFTATRWIANPE